MATEQTVDCLLMEARDAVRDRKYPDGANLQDAIRAIRKLVEAVEILREGPADDAD